jgi:hypothetical protein
MILATSDREKIDPAKLVDGSAHLPPNYNMVTVATVLNSTANVTGIRYG